jgi:LemA protein
MIMEYTLFIIPGLFILLTLYFYNKIVSSKQNVHEAWAGIDVQLKRRHDLIPNLVQVVQEYATHEKQLFTTIAEERQKALLLSEPNISKLSQIEEEINKSVRSIFAVAEAYPELKANENFLKLQTELTETEDQIASARRIYNSNVADYNTLISIFPSNIVAGVSHFSPLPFFQN